MAKLSDIVKNQMPANNTTNAKQQIREIQRELILKFEGRVNLFGDGANNRGIAYLEVIPFEDTDAYEVLDKDGNIKHISIPWKKRINFDLNKQDHNALWVGLQAHHGQNPEQKYTFHVTLNPFRGDNGACYVSLWINEVEIY